MSTDIERQREAADMTRNTLAREFAAEARRSTRMSKLEKKNREDRVASVIMRALTTELDIAGERITNFRFTDKGCSIDLADGGTIAVRITAYAAERPRR